MEQLLFFLFAATTLTAIVWSSVELLKRREDPLAERLEELQASAESAVARAHKRQAGGGFLNQFLYVLSMVPGLDDYLTDTEKELAQAGIRRKQALAYFVLFHLLFMLAMLGGMAYFQRDNPLSSAFGGMVAA